MSNQSLAVAEDYSTYDPPLSHHNHTKSLTSTWDMSESVIVIDPPLSISPISAQLLHKALFISHAPLPLTQLFTWGQLELSRVSALSPKSSHPPTPDQPVNNTEGTNTTAAFFNPIFRNVKSSEIACGWVSVVSLCWGHFEISTPVGLPPFPDDFSLLLLGKNKSSFLC